MEIPFKHQDPLLMESLYKHNTAVTTGLWFEYHYKIIKCKAKPSFYKLSLSVGLQFCCLFSALTIWLRFFIVSTRTKTTFCVTYTHSYKPKFISDQSRYCLTLSYICLKSKTSLSLQFCNKLLHSKSAIYLHIVFCKVSCIIQDENRINLVGQPNDACKNVTY